MVPAGRPGKTDKQRRLTRQRRNEKATLQESCVYRLSRTAHRPGHRKALREQVEETYLMPAHSTEGQGLAGAGR